jgi:hypothetical protein
LADVITDRALEKIDWNSTRINALTASTPAASRTPIHYPSDRECLEAIMPTVGKMDPLKITIGWFRNSLTLDLMALSENLLPEVKNISGLEVLGSPRELKFDQQGNLLDAFNLAVR